METILIILGTILSIVGILGSILPVLPGPQLVYVALILLQFTPAHPFSTQFLIILGLINVFVLVLDYIIPIRGTKKFGGTKHGTRGSTVGLIVGVIILPILGITIGPFGLISLIGGPFLGAYIGEKIGGKDHKKALKSATGSFIGFLTGTVLKLVLSLITSFYFFKEAIQIIKDIL
ncbi:DUF456 domain-containing protein [Candidatus Gracilibacteria bacterium]|nr:DUF456 domain-containing protein [Candidatus Gracilibacteria bacterium]